MSEAHEVGDFVENIPVRQSQAETPQAHLRVDRYGLDPMAEKAKARPGVPLLAGKSIPHKYTNALRARRRAPYITQDGQIKISVKDTGERTEDDTDRLVDVYFTYEEFPSYTMN